MGELSVRALESADHAWVKKRTIETWGAENVVVHEQVYHPADLPGFAVVTGGEIEGLLTYHLVGKSLEIVTLEAWVENAGIGSALIQKVIDISIAKGLNRIWLITTNDNLHALRFYQKRGFKISAIHINAVERSRRLKPEIPLTGIDGIPLRDEIEMEMLI